MPVAIKGGAGMGCVGCVCVWVGGGGGGLPWGLHRHAGAEMNTATSVSPDVSINLLVVKVCVML